MEKTNVLLLGGGGREHALAWKMAQSPMLGKLYVAPGNAGTRQVAETLGIGETDFAAVKKAIVEHSIGLVVVGPEAPLVKGIREFIEEDAATAHVNIVGPGRAGAMLEGSKSFSKEFMQRHGIPTARYGRFSATELAEAKAFLSTFSPPYVLKADGLAAGKGVLIVDNKTEAEQALDDMLVGGKFGEAGATVVIEEFLQGIELSVFVLTDGESYITLPEAKDYKRVGEGDTGLNTGGMGSVSPVAFADAAFMEKVEKRITQPTIAGLRKDGIPYKGFIFIGLMNCAGEPQVIEYNCRMGDPETESVIPRISSDLLPVLMACAEGRLTGANIETSAQAVASVMLVSGGYPNDYEKGKVISGLENVRDAIVFHAGTTMNEKGETVTSGGRVMTVTSYGANIAEALSTSYAQASVIRFDGAYFRRDIGFDLRS